jgi:hypothetical protein
LTDADIRKTNHRFLSHCRSGGGGLRLTRTEEKRLEPDAVFIELFEHFKKKIKNWFMQYIYFFTGITWARLNIGL